MPLSLSDSPGSKPIRETSYAKTPRRCGRQSVPRPLGCSRPEVGPARTQLQSLRRQLGRPSSGSMTKSRLHPAVISNAGKTGPPADHAGRLPHLPVALYAPKSVPPDRPDRSGKSEPDDLSPKPLKLVGLRGAIPRPALAEAFAQEPRGPRLAPIEPDTALLSLPDLCQPPQLDHPARLRAVGPPTAPTDNRHFLSN